jgi:DNA helicase HerA-like ATPase
LIRSKGVGAYFVTQNPLDVPDTVLAQLGNRVQHAALSGSPISGSSLNSSESIHKRNIA